MRKHQATPPPSDANHHEGTTAEPSLLEGALITTNDVHLDLLLTFTIRLVPDAWKLRSLDVHGD